MSQPSAPTYFLDTSSIWLSVRTASLRWTGRFAVASRFFKIAETPLPMNSSVLAVNGVLPP